MIQWVLPELEPFTLEEIAANPQDLPYKELALNQGTWDIEIPVRFITGAEAILQRIKVRFRFFLGEWFLDQRLGIPYYRDILVKNPDTLLITSIFRKALLMTPGVRSVPSFKAEFLPADRVLLCDFVAMLANGSTIIANAEPFVITGS